MKHTPGPWQWWDESTGRPANYDLCKLIGKNGEMVLSGYGGEGYSALGRSAEDQANAKLIAAAPDLLEALNIAHDHLVMSNKTHTRTFKAVIAAIEKATS